MLLAGVPPFHDKSEPRLLRSIMAGKYSLDDPVWEEVRGEGGQQAAWRFGPVHACGAWAQARLARGWQALLPWAASNCCPALPAATPALPCGLQISGEAKDLVSKLLVVDPASRLTCQQVGGNDACPVGLPDATELLRPGM